MGHENIGNGTCFRCNEFAFSKPALHVVQYLGCKGFYLLQPDN